MLKSCFFISRIGDAGSPEREFSDKLLKYIVAPVLEKCGYGTPVRADHITKPGVITHDVFNHIWNDDLVIADLTGGNPNVFYELAVRHIRRRPFVHLIQTGEKIPFDVAPNRTLSFGFDIEQAEAAKTALETMVNESNEEPGTVQTPLSLAVDFSTVGASSNPLQDGIAQILSIVQEIKGASGTSGDNPSSLLVRTPLSGKVVTFEKANGSYRGIGPATDVTFDGPFALSNWLRRGGFTKAQCSNVIDNLDAGQNVRVKFPCEEQD